MATLRNLYAQSNDPYIYEEIAKLNTRANITRKMALMDSINVELIKYSHNVQISIEDHLSGVYRREFESALQGLNVAIKPVINTEAIKAIINYPYAGAMFSDRVWRNKSQLLNGIEDDLTKNLIKGTSVQNMAGDLRARSNTAYYQAERLVRTETNYALTQGHLNGYKEAGVKKYEILAKIDSRTSAICKKKDGDIIEIEEGVEVGENCPPFHPNCRTTIIPVIEDDNIVDDTDGIHTDTADSNNSATPGDEVINKLKELNVTEYTDRRKLGKDILKSLDLEDIKVGIRKIDANGYCTISRTNDGTAIVNDYVLNSTDKRNNNYKIKTAFHEAYHARGHKRATDMNLNSAAWTRIEETFAESSAHYVAKQMGITQEIAPSYAGHLISTLPRLKQLDNFKECSTIADFGKVAWNNRIAGGDAKWLDLDKQLKAIEHNYIDYAVNNEYTNYIRSHKKELVEVMITNMPGYEDYASYMVTDADNALKNIADGDRRLFGNEKMVFENLLIITMNRLGVK